MMVVMMMIKMMMIIYYYVYMESKIENIIGFEKEKKIHAWKLTYLVVNPILESFLIVHHEDLSFHKTRKIYKINI